MDNQMQDCRRFIDEKIESMSPEQLSEFSVAVIAIKKLAGRQRDQFCALVESGMDIRDAAAKFAINPTQDEILAFFANQKGPAA